MDKKEPHTEKAAKQPPPPVEKKQPSVAQAIEEALEGIVSGEKKEETLETKFSSLTESMLRLQAEFDNYKKRTAKEKEKLAHQSEAKMVLRMLPIYEELQMAGKEAQKIQDEPLKKGVLLVLSKLCSSFEKEGLQEMKLEGEKFDPFRHEAAMHEPSDLPGGSIVRVIKKGYLFRGEILCHAIVSVSSGKPKSKEHAPEKKAASE